MGRKYPFLLLEGRTGERCAHEAPRRGIRKDGTWYTYGWDLTKKAPDGCKGDWTNAQHLPEGRGAVGRRRVKATEGSEGDWTNTECLPRRGEGAMGCARVNIGNRKTAQEAAEEATVYDANNLNQYTSIQTGEETAFVPTFDADGNQTKVKTSTGIWNVVYNAENRPVTFTSDDGTKIVECTYDKAPEGPEGDWTNAARLPEGRGAVGRLRVNMGRRHTRKITVNGSVTNYLRYIYRGYLQIAAINAVSGAFQWFILWDPTQSVATRPLGICKDGTWYTYGWDLTKNICESARRPPKGRLREQAVRAIGQTRSVCPAGARSREVAPSQVFSSGGTILTAYTYTPYGSVTANGNVTQPIQWSSEYNDSELGLVYYNYRHYNPSDGRWTGRDPLLEEGSCMLYLYDKPVTENDALGRRKCSEHDRLSGQITVKQVTLKHASDKDKNLSISDLSTYLSIDTKELARDAKEFARDKVLESMEKRAFDATYDAFRKAKGRLAYAGYVSTISYAYTSVEVVASATRCCCKSLQREKTEGEGCCDEYEYTRKASVSLLTELRLAAFDERERQYLITRINGAVAQLKGIIRETKCSELLKE